MSEVRFKQGEMTKNEYQRNLLEEGTVPLKIARWHTARCCAYRAVVPRSALTGGTANSTQKNISVTCKIFKCNMEGGGVRLDRTSNLELGATLEPKQE